MWEKVAESRMRGIAQQNVISYTLRQFISSPLVGEDVRRTGAGYIHTLPAARPTPANNITPSRPSPSREGALIFTPARDIFPLLRGEGKGEGAIQGVNLSFRRDRS